jgi:hypothetical protein
VSACAICFTGQAQERQAPAGFGLGDLGLGDLGLGDLGLGDLGLGDLGLGDLALVERQTQAGPEQELAALERSRPKVERASVLVPLFNATRKRRKRVDRASGASRAGSARSAASKRLADSRCDLLNTAPQKNVSSWGVTPLW